MSTVPTKKVTAPVILVLVSCATTVAPLPTQAQFVGAHDKMSSSPGVDAVCEVNCPSQFWLSDESDVFQTAGLAERSDLSALSELIDQATADAQFDQWDGPGSYGVKVDTHERALAIAHILPGCLPTPEISVTPSGSISFDWEVGSAAQLSIMASAGGGVSFAAYFSGDRIHGAMRFDRRRLPQEILAASERWAAQARAGFTG